MKWKDSNDSDELTAGSDESPYDGRGFSLKKANVPDDFIQSLLQKIKSPMVLAAGGLVVLIVLIVVFVAGAKKTVEIPQVKVFEVRINALEDRFANIETSIESVKRPVNSEKFLDQLNKRITRLEDAMNQQVDMLSKQLDMLKRQTVNTVSSSKVPAPEKTGTAGQHPVVTYHVVRKGENLYRISLRYGLKMDELLRLNNLKTGDVIQPGQKLMVRSQKDR